MTQLTMPDSAVPAASPSPAVRKDGRGRDPVVWDAVGRDGAGLASAVQGLEARKTLLAGAVAAVNAPDRQAAGLFEAALADPGARLWPFDLARVHLLYGEWLHRAREISGARQHLRAALAVFEHEGAAAWAELAATELALTELAATELPAIEFAATGPTRQPAVTRKDPPPVAHVESLTAQEHQVAELAAAGLSNKQIGARLYMSHRTVGAHLYRIFPKLGIESRAALRDALTGRVAA